jgi:signal transduction histidine kinase
LASVRLTFGGTVKSLEVSDDGVGFDAAAPAGFGLSQLRSRVADLGGSAEVIAARGQGTTVRVLLPADGPDVPLTATNGAFSATGPEVP